MKKLALLLTIALAMSVLTACQQTPQEIIVHEKNLDKMIESATKGQTEDNGATGTLAQTLGAEQTYTKELADAKGKVAIHVNAKVSIPAADSVSVQRVERADISQQAVDTIVQQLVKGNLFSAEAYVPTKDEIQQRILALEAVAAQGESGDANKKKMTPETAQAAIDELKKQLETAPETHTKTPISSKLEPYDDGKYSKGSKLLALAQSDQGDYQSLMVYNDAGAAVSYAEFTSEKNAFAEHMGSFTTKASIEAEEASGSKPSISSAQIASIPDVSMTKEAAQQKADALISALGIDYLTCISAEKAYGGSYQSTGLSKNDNPRKCVWFLRYMRKVNEVPVTYTVWDCMKVEKEAQSAPWSYEDMTFAIDDSGIVGFRWGSPYKVSGTVTERSNLLAYQEAMNVFDTMALAVNAWESYAEGNSNLTGIDINVNEIQFGLTRITEQNKRDSGLLVPAWDFMGTVTYILKVDGKTRKMEDGPVPILTVNAIDGSIINRSLGY